MNPNKLRQTILINGRKFLCYTLFVFVLLIFAFTSVNAATFTVINTNDSGAGSLRQAILDANANNVDNAINFNLSGCPNSICTITLTSGELTINPPYYGVVRRLTISNSTGANKLIISGNNTSRVIYVNQDMNVTINGVTITGGNSKGANFNDGGGILVFNSILTLTNSVVSGNTTTSNYFGSGISNFGTTIITNSTISDNMPGGGIENYHTLTMTNSTVSGNTGGGIISFGGTVNLTDVTVTNNQSFCTTCAGGIYNTSTVNLLNTIVAGNTMYGNGTSSPDLQGAVSSTSSFNIIGNGGGATGITNGTNNNQVGTDTNPIDPKLGPLADNGGATQTHALLPGSPAINAGNNANATATDQRGFARIVGGIIDIGAFESDYAAPLCFYSINSTSANFSSSGGAGSITVTTPDGCAYTAQSSSESTFITVQNTGGTRSGTINFTVDTNTGAARAGTIFVAGYAFNVIQDAAATRRKKIL